MTVTTYRVCPDCGFQNTNEANFCLHCGHALTAANNYIMTPHATDLDFPLSALNLSPTEVEKARSLRLTLATDIPAGYHSGGIIFAESDVAISQGPLESWKSLVQNLIALLLAKDYAGAYNLSIHENSHQFYLYGEALVSVN